MASMLSFRFGWVICVAALSAQGSASAQVNENGFGPDPDGDTNPATMTSAVANIGATDVKLDPRFTVLTFEPPPGAHNKNIGKQYTEQPYGVSFSKGLQWQICDDQRYYQYDSLCTYIRPPSGTFAAYYRDDRKTPLSVEFREPVCGVMMSIYPPGGKEGEKFKVTLEAKNNDGDAVGSATVNFAWTQNTFRWRVMAGGFFLKEPAESVDIVVARAENPGEVLQFLIDDLAYVKDDCEAVLAEIQKVAGFQVAADGSLETVPN